MSEQEYCNSADTFGVRLVNHVDDAVLPVGVHDFADAIGRCMLIDKTMFIADVLDCDASVVVCCDRVGNVGVSAPTADRQTQAAPVLESGIAT